MSYNNRGYAKYKLKDYKSALKDITRSIDLYPANSYAFRNRALVYLSLDKKEKACENLQKAIDLGYSGMYGNDVEELLKKNCE